MTVTHEHGKGFARTPEKELFLRATTMFYGKDTFYENADVADARAIELGRGLAVTDWGWFAPFLVWLRSDGNVRTMPMVLAVEGVRARLNAKMDAVVNDVTGHLNNGTPFLTNRELTGKVLQRPDEPGKLLDYHFTHYGKNVPSSVKRGVADAFTRMVNQRQALRYDKPGVKVRMGDVIEVTHPDPKDHVQSVLFKHLITVRRDREGYEPPVELDEIHARWELNKMSPDERHVFAGKVQNLDPDALRLWRAALAGSWEWGKLWLGEK